MTKWQSKTGAVDTTKDQQGGNKALYKNTIRLSRARQLSLLPLLYNTQYLKQAELISFLFSSYKVESEIDHRSIE